MYGAIFKLSIKLLGAIFKEFENEIDSLFKGNHSFMVGLRILAAIGFGIVLTRGVVDTLAGGGSSYWELNDWPKVAAACLTGSLIWIWGKRLNTIPDDQEVLPASAESDNQVYAFWSIPMQYCGVAVLVIWSLAALNTETESIVPTQEGLSQNWRATATIKEDGLEMSCDSTLEMQSNLQFQEKGRITLKSENLPTLKLAFDTVEIGTWRLDGEALVFDFKEQSVTPADKPTREYMAANPAFSREIREAIGNNDEATWRIQSMTANRVELENNGIKAVLQKDDR